MGSLSTAASSTSSEELACSQRLGAGPTSSGAGVDLQCGWQRAAAGLFFFNHGTSAVVSKLFTDTRCDLNQIRLLYILSLQLTPGNFASRHAALLARTRDSGILS